MAFGARFHSTNTVLGEATVIKPWINYYRIMLRGGLAFFWRLRMLKMKSNDYEGKKMKKRAFSSIAIVIASFLLVQNAYAITVGTVPAGEIGKAINNASANQDLSLSLTDIKADGTKTDLATTVTTDGSAIHSGNAIYVTNSKGFQKQTVGTSTVTTIRSGATFELKERQGTTLVVSNTKKSGKGSFVYTTGTDKITNFSPTVRAITAASLVKDGTFLAMIAKNGDGKQKLFLSGASLAKLKEYPLPKYATSCAGLVLSPNKKMVFAGCAFNVPGKPKGQRGYALLAVKNGKLSEKRTVNNKTVQYAAWLSNTQLITIQSDTSSWFTFTSNTVSANTITGTKTIGSTYYPEINGSTVIAVPFQVIRASAEKFWYAYMYFAIDNTSVPAGTFLGIYDSAANKDSLLLNDFTFSYFVDMQ